MKFQKYQAIFSSDATWAQDIVRYSTLKKLIKSYVRMTNTEEQISSSSQKPVKAVQSKPREGGGILAELENMEDESSEDEETFQTFNKEEAQEKVTRLLKEDIERSNRRFAEDLSNVRAYAKALADSSEAPSEEDLQQLRLRIKNCFDYARIQEEAFDCILRKWDKVMNVDNDCSLNGETFMAELRKEPFMDHSCLDEELNISQQLMMRLVEAKAQGTNEVNYSDADMDKRITVVSVFGLHILVIIRFSYCVNSGLNGYWCTFTMLQTSILANDDRGCLWLPLESTCYCGERRLCWTCGMCYRLCTWE
mmetsp:Transcript_26372/g.39126  ORF Transcript_26372/g.39126 Transcript_26372/m.39126 type:complete len:308 (+) Transcript_26372:132-1055(+)